MQKHPLNREATAVRKQQSLANQALPARPQEIGTDKSPGLQRVAAFLGQVSRHPFADRGSGSFNRGIAQVLSSLIHRSAIARRL